MVSQIINKTKQYFNLMSLKQGISQVYNTFIFDFCHWIFIHYYPAQMPKNFLRYNNQQILIQENYQNKTGMAENKIDGEERNLTLLDKNQQIINQNQNNFQDLRPQSLQYISEIVKAQQLSYQSLQSGKAEKNIKKKIACLYEKYTCKWSSISSELGETNQKSIENLFYNSIRSLSFKMTNLEKQKQIFQKNSINATLILNLVNLSIELKNLEVLSQKNTDILLHRVKKNVFRACFEEEQFTECQLWQLTKAIRYLNFKYKSYRINKVFSKSKAKRQQLAQCLYKLQVQKGNLQNQLQNQEQNIKVEVNNQNYMICFEPVIKRQQENSFNVQLKNIIEI